MRRGVTLAWLGLLAACDSLAGRDYVGEPLFTLQGSFAPTAAAPADPLGGVALMWQDHASAGGPGQLATPVPVELAFPAAFQVAIPVPPPAEARFSFADGDVQLAEAYVYVVADAGAAHLRTLGADRTHVLVYASADVPAGSLAADYLGGPLAAGYHLRRFTPVATAGRAQAAMIETCVASGATRDACATRRAYQLAPIADADPLAIAVAPP